MDGKIKVENETLPSSMKYPPPPVSPSLVEKWNTIQNELQQQIITCDTESWQFSNELSELRRVAGIDISYPAKDHDSYECDAIAAVIICEFPSMNVIHKEIQQVHLPVPYAAGYLAFRECDPIMHLLNKIKTEQPDKVPDVLLVDGNGILHPHRCGLACHIGVKSLIPSIGVAKNLHLVEGISVKKQDLQDISDVGNSILIKDNQNETLGLALKTANDAKNPIYISVGHKISIETAKRVVLKCSKHRIPEPIRFADFTSRELVRANRAMSKALTKITI